MGLSALYVEGGVWNMILILRTQDTHASQMKI